MKKEYLIYKLSEDLKEATRIENELFKKFDVKRGLRNEDGTGVLVGLTKIGNVVGYERIPGGGLKPIPGKLFYRGYDLEDLAHAILKEKRFGFEEVAYLLLSGRLPDREELASFRELINDNMPLEQKTKMNIIELEGNNIVRLQLAGKLRFEYGGIAAERAACRRRRVISNYLAAAALADIDAHTVAIAVKTLLFVVRYPIHVVGLIIFQALVIAFERFKLKLGVAIRTLHFPGCAVIGYKAAAAGTFILNGILRFHKRQTLSLSLNGSPHFGQNFGNMALQGLVRDS